MIGYEKIKQLAKKNHCNITDLLVLAKQNDPFFVGSEASVKAGLKLIHFSRFNFDPPLSF